MLKVDFKIKLIKWKSCMTFIKLSNLSLSISFKSLNNNQRSTYKGVYIGKNDRYKQKDSEQK